MILPDPLPLVLEEAPDESLSSWLNRHAEFYGIAPSALSHRVGIGRLAFAGLDHRLNESEARTLASAMRRSPTSISNMTHLQHQDRLMAMIGRGGEPVHACSECRQRNRRDNQATATMKSWSHGWRITCPLCGSRLQDVDGGKAYPPADAFEHLWDEAWRGEELIANIDLLPADRAALGAVAFVAFASVARPHGYPTANRARQSA